MTRDEWIERLEREWPEFPTQGITVHDCRELAALLLERPETAEREPWLPESGMKTLRSVANEFAHSNAPCLRSLAALIDSLTPPPPAVQWVNCGCNAMAEVGEWSLSTWRLSCGNAIAAYAWQIRATNSGLLLDDSGSQNRLSLVEAKAQAETKVRELQGATR